MEESSAVPACTMMGGHACQTSHDLDISVMTAAFSHLPLHVLRCQPRTLQHMGMPHLLAGCSQVPGWTVRRPMSQPDVPLTCTWSALPYCNSTRRDTCAASEGSEGEGTALVCASCQLAGGHALAKLSHLESSPAPVALP